MEVAHQSLLLEVSPPPSSFTGATGDAGGMEIDDAFKIRQHLTVHFGVQVGSFYLKCFLAKVGGKVSRYV